MSGAVTDGVEAVCGVAAVDYSVLGSDTELA